MNNNSNINNICTKILLFCLDSGDQEGSECAGCNKELNSCKCQDIVCTFHEINCKLIELELLERLVGNVLTSLIYIRIKDHVIQVCDRSFDVSQLAPLENVSTININKLNKIIILF